jgi:hypothetical protein
MRDFWILLDIFGLKWGQIGLDARQQLLGLDWIGLSFSWISIGFFLLDVGS